MEQLLTFFAPQPGPDERPAALNSPFDTDEPPPLARRAADEVMASLSRGEIAPGIPTSCLHGPDGGKMFAVLVVETGDGRVGYLKSLSGQLDRAWDVEGYAPPVFDRQARAQVEPAGEAAVKGLTARVEAASAAEEWQDVDTRLAALRARHEAEAAELRARHATNRAARHAQRAELQTPHPGPLPKGRGSALDQLSRVDDTELRHAKARWRTELKAVEAERARLARRLTALERLRRIVSQEVSRQLYDTYQFENARGQHLSLRALFAPHVPSAGTGDCAAPKLLVYAARHALKPLALAEFWWGAPPPGGGRTQGAFYPACRDKCGQLLPFLLEGTPVAPSRRYRPPDLTRHELPVVLEDEQLLVVNKPAGLLSVPGTDATVVDSVLARMRARFPKATGPLLVHRLDVETSGLLIVALDSATHAALQRQFLHREIEKTYIAWVDGEVPADEGVISLPVRVDLEQRPRQLVDFEHGKHAVTRWRVLERRGGRTRLALSPQTGRTHQLRVHAAHVRGLNAPIVGDRLYGRPDLRLMLHAEELRFTHPATGLPVVLRAPAPF